MEFFVPVGVFFMGSILQFFKFLFAFGKILVDVRFMRKIKSQGAMNLFEREQREGTLDAFG